MNIDYQLLDQQRATLRRVIDSAPRLSERYKEHLEGIYNFVTEVSDIEYYKQYETPKKEEWKTVEISIIETGLDSTNIYNEADRLGVPVKEVTVYDEKAIGIKAREGYLMTHQLKGDLLEISWKKG